MINVFSVKEIDSDLSFNNVPESVTTNIGKAGYFTLISVDQEDYGEELAGLAQFYVDMTKRELFYARLEYIYVTRGYRRHDVAFQLLQNVNNILKKQEVDVITINIPYNENGEVDSDISEQEIKKFFKECGFISAQSTSGRTSRLYKLTRR